MYKSNKHCSESTKKRVNEIILSLLIKDWETLKKYSFEGLPDEVPMLRSLLWKMNLKYLNNDLDRWDYYLTKKRSDYEELKTNFLEKMKLEGKLYKELEYEKSKKEKDHKNKIIQEQKLTDHDDIKSFFYNQSEKEIYMYIIKNNNNKVLKGIDNVIIDQSLIDKKLLEDIDKDIRRTHTYMHFFHTPSKRTEKISNEEIAKVVERKKANDTTKNIDELYNKQESWETNSDVLVRILFIYAKLNPEIGYVQGMNEILAPIYYCFFSEEESNYSHSSMDDLDKQKENDYKYVPDVEADSFWTFASLMEDIKELFIQGKDNEQGGVFAKLNTLNDLLKIVDKDMHAHLIKIKLDLQLIAFKWIVLLFTQEFLMPDVLRIWDALLSENDRFYMMYLISLAILLLKKKDIMKSDFAGVISKIQKINNLDIEKILTTVTEIRQKYDKKIKKALSSK